MQLKRLPNSSCCHLDIIYTIIVFLFHYKLHRETCEHPRKVQNLQHSFTTWSPNRASKFFSVVYLSKQVQPSPCEQFILGSSLLILLPSLIPLFYASLRGPPKLVWIGLRVVNCSYRVTEQFSSVVLFICRNLNVLVF